MITADKLKTLTTMSAGKLTEAIRAAGYKKDVFWGTPVFLGITNGGQFCYSADYPDPEGKAGEYLTTKVYISYDPTADRVSADY